MLTNFPKALCWRKWPNQTSRSSVRPKTPVHVQWSARTWVTTAGVLASNALVHWSQSVLSYRSPPGCWAVLKVSRAFVAWGCHFSSSLREIGYWNFCMTAPLSRELPASPSPWVDWLWRDKGIRLNIELWVPERLEIPTKFKDILSLLEKDRQAITTKLGKLETFLGPGLRI